MITQAEFTDPQWAILQSNKSRNLFHSGKGGGKTHAMGTSSALFVSNIPKVIGLIAANTYGQLTDSTLLEIFKVWKEYFGWKEYNKSNPDGVFVIDKQPPEHFKDHGYTFKSNANKIFFANGAVVQTVSLDNYKALDGRTIGWALLDETKDTREEAVKTVIISRLRQLGICQSKSNKANTFGFVSSDDPDAGTPANPLFIFTAPAKEQWLTDFFNLSNHQKEIESKIFSETEFFQKEFGNKKVVISSTYHNQKNLPPNYISDILGDLSSDQAALEIFGSPFGKSGNEYYIDFNSTKHIKPCFYTEGYPLHLTFDFNVNPYMSAQVWQIVPDGDRYKVRCLNEYAFQNPKNNIESVCEAFDEDYGHLCGPGFFYYGDASGKNKLPVKSVKDYFKVIQRELKHLVSQSSRRLLRQNPRHRAIGKNTLGRRDFMNKCFRGGFNFDIEINPSCQYTIQDFNYVKEDANGAKLKEKAEINGVRCEKYGHMSDAGDAFFSFNWGDWNKE